MLSTFNFLIEDFVKNKKTGLSCAGGSSRALFLVLLYKRVRKPLVILTHQQRRAEEIYDDLTFYFDGITSGSTDVCILPQWTSIPYRVVTIPPEIIARRISILSALAAGDIPKVLLIPHKSFIQRVIPPACLKKYNLLLKKGDEIERGRLIDHLLSSGYTKSFTTVQTGEYSIRGGLIDIFSPSKEYPCRVEFDGDTVYSMRLFDPESQRSLSEIPEIRIIPASEFILPGNSMDNALERLRKIASERDIKKQKRKTVEAQLLSEEHFPGREYFLPLFYDTVPLSEYLPEDAVIVADDAALWKQEAEDFGRNLTEIFELQIKDEQAFPNPLELYIEPSVASDFIKDKVSLFLNISAEKPCDAACFLDAEGCEDLRALIIPARELPFEKLAEMLKRQIEDGWRLFIVMPSDIDINRIITILSPYGINMKYYDGNFLENLSMPFAPGVLVILKGSLRKGFRIRREKFAVIGEADIFREKKKSIAPVSLRGDEVSDFSALKPGEFVVHERHGIGIFRGLKKMNVENSAGEFITVEYQGGDRLYIPIFGLGMIHKYRMVGGKQPLVNRLGSPRWEITKKKVRNALRELSQDLLRLYAKRKVLSGFAFPLPDYIYTGFETTFPYEETPDQIKAIEDVLKDMESENPMDRLVCGDVGFGKTEVAIRAAFRGAIAGKQIALLVPTTLLAYQHFNTFSGRFRNYPVEVRLLSRFRKRTEVESTLKDLREGRVDMVIGTHMLLGNDIQFKDLGLLIIDEEHRFGVKQKERIKRLKEGVDVLTLTATPIPRSLQMSLSGIRDMSIIYTPPPDRHSVRTFVSYFNEETIADAIVLEKMRGGQVFFIHNRIEDIVSVSEYIKKLVPEAAIGIVHSKMRKDMIERVMVDFVQKKMDVLVSTSIIASGLDIPSANTLLVNNAHLFGLTDLYQLRGRVGRSKEIGYAYFMIPENTRIPADAQKRLRAIQEFSGLGAGFKLALRDLEIRGSGELLGIRQSGHIALIGFDLYSRLLEDTINALKGTVVSEEVDPDIKVEMEAFIPDDYIPDVETRLEIYKKLTLARKEDDIFALKDEIEDRFGSMPKAVDTLLDVSKIKVLLCGIGIVSMVVSNERASFSINEVPKTNISGFIKAFNASGVHFDYLGKNRFAIPGRFSELKELYKILKKINNAL